MSDDISDKKKLGYVKSNKQIPMCNIFNRTPFFVPVHANHYNKVISKKDAIEFKSQIYDFKLYGFKLNNKVDYPILALIIKHWVNKRQTEGKAVTVRIELDEFIELLSTKYSQTRQKNYDPIKQSLHRLSKVKISLNIKYYKTDEALPILAFEKFYYKTKPKYIKVRVSELLEGIYSKMWNISLLDFTFMNVIQIKSVLNIHSNVLTKFLMSQDYDYIDFKLEALEKLLGFKYKEQKQYASISRFKITKTLDALVKSEFITQYKTETTRGWDQIRIIPVTLCDDLEIVNQVIDLLKSNFSNFRSKPVINEEKEKLKAKARLDPKIKKYENLMILLARIE